MKFAQLILVASLISGFSMAVEPVAPQLVDVGVSVVDTKGTILRETRNHPYTNFLVSIPVEVSTGSVCTTFVGQQEVAPTIPTAVVALVAKGTVDPLTEACIEIFPMPVRKQFTIKVKVLTGGFVPAEPVQTRLIEVGGVLHLLTLDMSKDTVTITAIK